MQRSRVDPVVRNHSLQQFFKCRLRKYPRILLAELRDRGC